MVWWILLGLAVLILLLNFRTKNAIWGAATFGLFIGLVVAIFRRGFDWWTVGKAVVIATFIGAALQWSARWSEKKR